MESVDSFKNLKKGIYERLISDNVIAKWVKTRVWQKVVNDKTIDIYPVIIWNSFVEIKVDTNRNYFTKAIERIVSSNDEFERGEFSNGILRFYYTESFSNEVLRLRENIIKQTRKS